MDESVRKKMLPCPWPRICLKAKNKDQPVHSSTELLNVRKTGSTF